MSWVLACGCRGINARFEFKADTARQPLHVLIIRLRKVGCVMLSMCFAAISLVTEPHLRLGFFGVATELRPSARDV